MPDNRRIYWLLVATLASFFNQTAYSQAPTRVPWTQSRIKGTPEKTFCRWRSSPAFPASQVPRPNAHSFGKADAQAFTFVCETGQQDLELFRMMKRRQRPILVVDLKQSLKSFDPERIARMRERLLHRLRSGLQNESICFYVCMIFSSKIGKTAARR